MNQELLDRIKESVSDQAGRLLVEMDPDDLLALVAEVERLRVELKEWQERARVYHNTIVAMRQGETEE